MIRRQARSILDGRPGPLLAGLTFALGAVYVWTVKPGLPYDEPSHWSTVLFYANHGTLPILGHPGVSYEAQQGPLAYTLDALLVSLARDLGASVQLCFRLVRLFGVLELACAVPLIAAITRRLIANEQATFGAVAVFAVNPMLLAMSASVQNDTLALLLGLLSLALALSWIGERPSVPRAVVVGLIAGLALLAKLTALPAALAIAAWLAWRHRAQAVATVTAFVGAILAVSGWWFIRNIVLYGDPTGAAGVHRLGLSYPPYKISGIGSVGHLAESAVTYMWFPTEYLRNVFHAPSALKACIVLLMLVAIVLALTRRHWPSRGAAELVVGCGVLAVVYWLATSLSVQDIPPRLAYMVWPLWIALVALSLTWRRFRSLVTVVVAILLMGVLNAWTLYEVASYHSSIQFIPSKLASRDARPLMSAIPGRILSVERMST